VSHDNARELASGQTADEIIELAILLFGGVDFMLHVEQLIKPLLVNAAKIFEGRSDTFGTHFLSPFHISFQTKPSIKHVEALGGSVLVRCGCASAANSEVVRLTRSTELSSGNYYYDFDERFA
jgi:hypothetical protein